MLFKCLISVLQVPKKCQKSEQISQTPQRNKKYTLTALTGDWTKSQNRVKIRVLFLLELNSTDRNVTNQFGLTLRNGDVRAFKRSHFWHLETLTCFGEIFRSGVG